MNVRFVGLDVHRDSIAIAVADDDGSSPYLLQEMANDTPRVVKKLRELGRERILRCCYEAGPTGFELHRALKRAGIDCFVVAPSRVPDARGSRMKTDSLDAVRLARFLRSGDLAPIHVPDGETEAMRDLSRARLAAMKAKQAARQHLSSMALRHGRKYPGKRQGTRAHRAWLREQAFEHEAQRRAWADYLATYEAAIERESKVVKDLEELAAQWVLEPVVSALMALRSISLVSAVSIVAEVGEFGRFAKATHFASFTGMTPSEHSSGERRMQGGITLAGNAHIRRLLVEAAWNYRYPTLPQKARERGRNTTPEARQIAEKAQNRLHRRFVRLTRRGKEKNKIAVAIGRELACFIWAIANASSVRERIEGNLRERARKAA